MSDLIKIAESYCKAWNNLDIHFIEDHLLVDFEYNSQLVLEPIQGKEKYLLYLNRKFKSIKKSGEPVFAELAYYNQTPCAVLIQHLNTPEKSGFSREELSSEGILERVPVYTIERKAVIIFKFKENKLKQATLCVIAPAINQVTRTGIFPK